MSPPIFLYYGIDNMYLNHRRRARLFAHSLASGSPAPAG
jgi:hypothetical protein